jgi:hypothetical protein
MTRNSRNRAGIPALVNQRLLKFPGEVTMPREERSLEERQQLVYIYIEAKKG